MRVSISLLVFLIFFTGLAAQESVQVSTNYGPITGLYRHDTGLNYFLGVPYAKPPVKSLRWKAPQEPESWTAPIKTQNFRSAAVQTNVFGDMIYRGEGNSEDCLYLNIWSPAVNSEEKLPVLVYFYGGGFVAGDGSEPRYDGAALARKGIVTVTVNYRLNIFGFFAHPELSKEATYNASGNYGLLDQAMALKWVSENIQNFGGDPEKITIAGESAGSISVSAQMASPLSRDNLAGAIGESGAMIYPTLPPVPLSEAEEIGLKFLEDVGYSFEKFRELPTDSVFKIFQESGRFGFPTVIDGYFLPRTLPEIFRDGEQAKIPLLVGWNSAESDGRAILGDKEMTVANFQEKVKELYPEKSETVNSLYNAENDKEVAIVSRDLASDRFISYSTWKWSQLHLNNSKEPVYRYLFKRIRPSGPEASEASGAAHASEIEYFLGNLSKDQFPYLTETDFEISETIQQYLVNFIKTGDPNSEGLEFWPSLQAGEKPLFMVMDENFEVEESKNEERYEFHDEYYENN